MGNDSRITRDSGGAFSQEERRGTRVGLAYLGGEKRKKG